MKREKSSRKSVIGLCGATVIQVLIFSALILFVITGCQTTPTQNGALIGGGVGAAAGQILGGNTESTLIGTGVGALGGALLNDGLSNQREIGQQEGYQQGIEDAAKPKTQVNVAPPNVIYQPRYIVPSCPPPPSYIIVDPYVPVSPVRYHFYHSYHRYYRNNPWHPRRSHVNIHYWSK